MIAGSLLCTEGLVPLPASVFSLYGDLDGDELFYTFHSFVHAPTYFRYDFLRDVSELLVTPAIDSAPGPYETRHVFASSKGGTRVPMFLIHKKDLPRSREHPTLLYGYGGFNITLTPQFFVSRLTWLGRGEFARSVVSLSGRARPAPECPPLRGVNGATRRR